MSADNLKSSNNLVSILKTNQATALLLGAILLQLFSNGRWILPVTTWLAPIAWLLFLERYWTRKYVSLAFIGFLVVEFISWRGLVPAPGMLYFLIVGIYGLVYFLPFLVHRIFLHRWQGFATTLIFPAAWVAIEFVFQQWITPYGSWFSLVYTQDDFLSLLQLSSLTGLAGISFLITWFGAICVWALRPARVNADRMRAAMIFAVLFIAVLSFGEFRLASRSDQMELTRVAGIVPSPELAQDLETALRPVRSGEETTEKQMEELREIADRLNNDLLERTAREAQAGARIISWSETAGRVLKEDEPRLLVLAQNLARNENVALMLDYGVWVPDTWPPFENKVVAISPEGDLEWEYQKAEPIVGAESAYIKAGDGRLSVLPLSTARLGAVICHDLDFPPLLRQASAQNIGLMIGPSADWAAITPLHANMAKVRAIEGGYSLFRPTSNGRSIAIDTRGRTLMAVDFPTDAFVSYVPTAPVQTIYGKLGDWFAWLCLVAILFASGHSVISHRQMDVVMPEQKARK